jgi:hypothetical protein
MLWRFLGQRCASVPFYDLDLGSGVSDIRKGILRDDRHGRVDIVKADVVARAAIRRQSACAEADDAYIAGAVLTAETKGEAHAGVTGVIRRRGVAEFVVAEDLCSMANTAIRERAYLGTRRTEGLLGDAQAGIEIACGYNRVALIGVDDQKYHGEQGRAGDYPQQALAPGPAPIHRQNQQRRHQEGDGQIKIEGEHERCGDADQGGAERSTRRKEQIEKSGFGCALRTKPRSRRMAEEASEEQFRKEEER